MAEPSSRPQCLMTQFEVKQAEVINRGNKNITRKAKISPVNRQGLSPGSWSRCRLRSGIGGGENNTKGKRNWETEQWNNNKGRYGF